MLHAQASLLYCLYLFVTFARSVLHVETVRIHVFFRSSANPNRFGTYARTQIQVGF